MWDKCKTRNRGKVWNFEIGQKPKFSRHNF